MGMVIYAYVMPFNSYTMNLLIYPSPNDIGQVEGLCGNFNGDRYDDLIHRDTGRVDPYSSWWNYYPDDFSMSWE